MHAPCVSYCVVRTAYLLLPRNTRHAIRNTQRLSTSGCNDVIPSAEDHCARLRSLDYRKRSPQKTGPFRPEPAPDPDPGSRNLRRSKEAFKTDSERLVLCIAIPGNWYKKQLTTSTSQLTLYYGVHAFVRRASITAASPRTMRMSPSPIRSEGANWWWGHSHRPRRGSRDRCPPHEGVHAVVQRQL